LAKEFIEAGFPVEDVRVLPMDSAGEPSASLVVRYRGTSKKRPILFVAHMDVVAAAESNWGRDPFTLSEDDEYYYGRGVLDDKFGTTVLTSTFLRLRQEGFVPERDLIDAEIAFNVAAGIGRLDTQFKPVAMFLRFAENPDDRNASDYLSNDPEYVGIVRTTCVPTMLRGGHAENALPQSATVTVNCRVYPGVAVSDVAMTLKQVVNNSDTTLATLGDPLPSPPSPVRDDVMAIVATATQQQYPEFAQCGNNDVRIVRCIHAGGGRI